MTSATVNWRTPCETQREKMWTRLCWRGWHPYLLKTETLKSTTYHPASRRQQSCCGCDCYLQFGGVGGYSPTLLHLLPHLPDSFSFVPLPQKTWQTFGNRHQNASDWWKFTALHFLIAFDNREKRTCICGYALLCVEQKDSIGNCCSSEQVMITILLTKICNSAAIAKSPSWTRTNLQLEQWLKNASDVELALLFTIPSVLDLIVTYSNVNQKRTENQACNN